MTGPEHYLRAETLLREAQTELEEFKANTLAMAQVHATLALAAATAGNDPDGGQSAEVNWGWRQIIDPDPTE